MGEHIKKAFIRDMRIDFILAFSARIYYLRYTTVLTGGGIMSAATNLQDSFLNQLRKEKIPVVVYLTNGVRLKGTIKGFDNFVILLKETSMLLVYKHAVSTIMPEREVNLRPAPGANDAA